MALPGIPRIPVGGAAAPPPATATPQTPRELADELFNQVMAAREGGDAATVERVLPSALDAYVRLGAKDGDSLYHLSLLQLEAKDFASAMATVQALLQRSPGHLLALSVGARVAQGKGDAAAARRYREQFLAGYDVEVAKQLPEYLDHERILPIEKKAALEALGRAR